ncbi:hypothetical protein [uncultured Psychrobacter sp.]|nr:hypothetical protein [uncultured Psychrobacter sp.]
MDNTQQPIDAFYVSFGIMVVTVMFFAAMAIYFIYPRAGFTA